MQERLLDVTGPIETEPVDPDDVVTGSPAAGSRALAVIADAEVGVWEMTAGTSRDVEADEVFVVLSGSASVVVEDGTTLTLTPGTVVRLFTGDRTTWTVHETLRKIYVT